ncbi:zinc ribbon domain-containing protein [Brevibacillus migulae]|uniref:zinc ribbon domain-containing protein n=1 Tax=Brevibacillus migulae TaxID=1644114 RepID=UPI00106DD768|nr:zinc ribbon domain-containing protein [Brevibacillus migulae]
MNQTCSICKETLDHLLKCSCTRSHSVRHASGQKGCPKCGGTSASTAAVSTTGGLLSRMMDVQNHSFVAVSCDRCGYTEFYKSNGSPFTNLIDLFFS